MLDAHLARDECDVHSNSQQVTTTAQLPPLQLILLNPLGGELRVGEAF
jgi:hypothetical protein